MEKKKDVLLMCQECNKDHDNNLAIESLNHFILECPAHEQYRAELIEKMGRNCFNLKDIMQNTDDYIKALVTYIKRTRQFRDSERH